MSRTFTLTDLRFGYGPDLIRLDRAVFPAAEGMIIDGPNGSGKTTLLKLLAGILKPRQGVIEYEGRPIEALDRRATRILFVHQRPYIFKGTVRGNLTAALYAGCVPEAEHPARVGEALALFGLDAIARKRHFELSTGERQKTAIARALALRPEVLLLDEPATGLDAGGRRELITILHSALSRGIGVVLATHDPDIALALDMNIFRIEEALPPQAGEA